MAVGTTVLPPLLLPPQISPPFSQPAQGAHVCVCSKDNGLGHAMNLMAGMEVQIRTPAATVPDAAAIAASATIPVTAAAAAIVAAATIATTAMLPSALPPPLLLQPQ